MSGAVRTEPVRLGHCRCGRITFEARGEPNRVGVCHCESCRRATGAAFATYVDYPLAAVVVSGEPAVWSATPGVERTFCASCGSPISYYGDPWPNDLSLHLGAFAHPEEFAPHHATFEQEGFDWARRALAPILADGKR